MIKESNIESTMISNLEKAGIRIFVEQIKLDKMYGFTPGYKKQKRKVLLLKAVANRIEQEIIAK